MCDIALLRLALRGSRISQLEPGAGHVDPASLHAGAMHGVEDFLDFHAVVERRRGLTPVRIARPQSPQQEDRRQDQRVLEETFVDRNHSGIGISASGSLRRAPSRRPLLPTMSMPSEPDRMI